MNVKIKGKKGFISIDMIVVYAILSPYPLDEMFECEIGTPFPKK